MPKIDPETGCTVMTQAEFWASEAEHEGKGRQGWELMNDMMNEIEDENERLSEEMRKDPEAALQLIKNYLDGDEEDVQQDSVDTYGFCGKHIKKVVEFLDARYDGSMRGTDCCMCVKLKMTDGSTRTVEYCEWNDYGTRMDPPDGGVDLAVIAVNDVPVVNRFERDQDAPPCAECQRSDPPPTKGGVPNSADYLMPISRDQGKTIESWEPRCSYHMPKTWSGEPTYGDWYGPMVKLDKYNPPNLPMVREDDE
jgi:hypothetical protein